MNESVDTVIVGGGQAGLATSYHLSRNGREHVVLEQAAQAGDAWRNGRWDSFTLVTPNWSFRMPGAEYRGDDPGGFMCRDDVVARFERYIEDFDLPVRFGRKVDSVRRQDGRSGYLVTVGDSTVSAASVVVATGLFQTAKVPAMDAALPQWVTRLHSGQYRSPKSLPPGAVLVVGSGQSGCQIAQELHESGRPVYLCVGGAGRVPRRYRGRDIVDWLESTGFFDRTVEDLPSPRARFAAMPHVSGRDGGRDLNLHEFARDGIVLLGHIEGLEGDTVRVRPDLADSLAKADEFETMITTRIDRFIDDHDLDVPAQTLPVLRDGYDADTVERLDLAAAGISTVIWAVGYSFDFERLVDLPVYDEYGYPVQDCGATRYPGLYFVGLPWLTRQKSGLLLGVGDDAESIASAIATA